MNVLGLAGSLRKQSLNRGLLVAAAACPGVELQLFDLRPVPMYDGDLDTDDARPEAVEALKAAVAAADAVLLATPEFNHSIPGVTKNALDWVSRPAFRSPFAHKSVGLMGAAPGIGATFRAQEHLKLVLLSMHACVYPTAFTMPHARQAFTSSDGPPTLSSPEARDRMGRWMGGFVDWVERR